MFIESQEPIFSSRGEGIDFVKEGLFRFSISCITSRRSSNFQGGDKLFLLLNIALMMCFSAAAYSSEGDLDQSTQCFDTSATYKRALLSSVRHKKGLTLNEKLYVTNVSEEDYLIDTRVDPLHQTKKIVRPKNAIIIPLNQIKTKTYLKDKNIVLMGHGWDDYRLGYELDSLKTRGFQSVKILQYGVLSIVNDYSLFPYLKSQVPLHKVSVDEIFSSALLENNKGSFLFINLGQRNSVFDKYGLQSIHTPFKENSLFYHDLARKIDFFKDRKNKLQIVISHDDVAIYEKIFKKIKKDRDVNYWFVNGGNKAIFTLNKKISAAIIDRSKVVVSCPS